MPITLSLNVLIDYTDWEREQWHGLLARSGDAVLMVTTGPHGDGRFATVGEILRHIFSAEKRYIERLSGRELTDSAAIPSDNIAALFQFGQQSRKELREFVTSFPEQDWDIMNDYNILKYALRATPKKIVTHILMHEIRHWAQIATLLRLNGFKGEFHDFLFSPAMGGHVRLHQESPATR
jgi:uncharacterized damage-inducible protein DinB